MANILTWIFGTKSDRDVKRMKPTIEAINALEPEMKAMSDEQLAAQTQVFREKLAKGATLDDLLVPAFATVREVSRRVLKMRDFDVQLMGGITLQEGKIAEMKTGEGKTLVATLAVYLNALEGKGVHVVTVNDYLAKRDSEWMGKVYKALGMSVGAIVHDMNDSQRKAAYASDITYGTNNEFGFDYLRDNMKFVAEDRVQRGHNFAIVDEVDSILIDEARTPLIISGPGNEQPTDQFYKVDQIIPFLQQGEELNADDPDLRTTTGDYIVDEKLMTVTLTDEGNTKVEQLLGLGNTYDVAHMEVNDMVTTALKAHALYHRDHNYVVKDGEIVIVDEFTGRLMPGRRWNDGLHQAIEAKEGLPVQPDNQTLATITFQNYFRMYKKLAGMTGTADTEAAEFAKIYNLDVVQIPTNKPMLREEFNDVVYRTEDEKFRAVAREIKAAQERGQPVLVGTVSIEKSEKLSKLLDAMDVKHKILNAKSVMSAEDVSDAENARAAKDNATEAEIVAQAGRKGVVTVSTNMAGRGTDILLGGNPDFMAKQELVEKEAAQQLAANDVTAEGPQPDGKTTVFFFGGNKYAVLAEQLNETVARYKVQTDKEHDEVVALNGLYVIGTERHESRRIDNQLRGRAGRQGDPGSSRFFISLEDRLSRVFGGPKLKGLLTALGMTEDDPIESRLVSSRIAAAQKGIEQQNFDARKNLIEYDDVMNMQRKVVYGTRNGLLDGADQKERLLDMIDSAVCGIIDHRCPENRHPEAWDWTGLDADIRSEFGVALRVDKLQHLNREKLEDTIYDQLEQILLEKEKLGGNLLLGLEKMIMLNVIDSEWKDHLLSMDYLKKGIGLRSYAQQDPLVAYKKEAYEEFVGLMNRIETDTLRGIFNLRVVMGDGSGAIQFPAVADQFSSAATTAESAPSAIAPDAVQLPVPKAPPPASPGLQGA